MPTYTYQCKKCEFVFEQVLPISKRYEPEAVPCPECNEFSVHKLIDTPPLADPVRLGRIKPPEGFKDVLRNIRDRNPGSVLDV